jgi:hypothetical protein
MKRHVRRDPRLILADDIEAVAKRFSDLGIQTTSSFLVNHVRLTSLREEVQRLLHVAWSLRQWEREDMSRQLINNQTPDQKERSDG